MKSANQIIQYSASLPISVTDLNGDTVRQLTIESPVAGKLLKARAKVYVEDLSNTAALAVLVSKGQQFGEVGALAPLYLQAMYAWTGTGKVSAVEGNPSPRYFFLPSQIDSELPDNESYELERTFTIGELVQQGDNINVYAFPTSLANVLTTGIVRVTIVFEFLVAHLATLNGRLPRSSAEGIHVSILANLDNDDNVSQYYPPSSGRISNIRLSIFGAIASSFAGNDFLYFGKKLFTDAQNTDNVIYQHTDGIMLTGEENLDAADDSFNLVLTTYSRELIFVKKGEPMIINYQNSSDTTRAYIIIEFEFIPDFNAQVDLWYSDLIANVPDATINIWSNMIPFDMFIEKVELITSLNDLTVDGYQYLMAIKTVAELLSNIDMITGSVLSTTLIDNAQYSQLPSNILGAMPFSAQTDRPSLEVEVYDYFPASSWIAVLTALETSAVEDLTNLLHIQGRSRVKSNNFGVNFLTGPQVKEQVRI